MHKFINKIQANFNNASSSYEHVSQIQKQAAEFLVQKTLSIKNFHPATILDVGTGTGYIPELLLPQYSNSYYYLNDIAIEMLKICQDKFSKYSNIQYISNNMLELDHQRFDLVISNLSLQWVDNLWHALRLFYAKSFKVFAFSTLLNGTFIEWENILNKYQNIKLHNYPQTQELIKFCGNLKKNAVFNYWKLEIPLSFDNPARFMKYLKLLGASAANEQMNFSNLKLIFKEQQKNLTVTYKIFFGIFNKLALAT